MGTSRGHRRGRTPVDHGKGRPRSLTPPRRGLPSYQARGLFVALGVHAALFAVLILVSYLRYQPEADSTGDASTLTVTFVAADDTGPSAVDALLKGGPYVAPTPAPTAPFAPTPGMRPFDTTRIRAREMEIFPFLTSRLTFLDALRPERPQDGRPSVRLAPAAATAGDLPPLILAPPAFDALVDAAWSRRDRWRNFQSIARAADRHHPNEGDLPALVRAHVERNLLQPYHEAPTPDARFWVILGMAADHRDLIEFVARYAGRHPSSRTTTELLFLLDELAEAGHDAFNILRLTPLQSLSETRRLSPNDLALAQALQDAWNEWAHGHDMGSLTGIDGRTDAIRSSILSAIIETSPGGYGANDARFLAGRMAWTRKDTRAAVGWWREMGTDARDGFADVRQAIAGAIYDDGSFDAERLEQALATEQRRWLATATARLARFGFTPQTF